MAKLEELVAKFDALTPEQQLQLASMLVGAGQIETAMLLARRVVENWEIAKTRRRAPVKGARS